MKIVGVLLVIIGLLFFSYKPLKQKWQLSTAINCGECSRLPDSSECLREKIRLVDNWPWWKAKCIYLPFGTYNISGVVEIPYPIIIGYPVSICGISIHDTIIKKDQSQ